MADTRFIYLQTNTGDTYTNNEDPTNYRYKKLVAVDYENLNGEIEDTGFTTGLGNTSSVILFKPHTVKMSLIFDSRADRSAFVPVLPMINKIGYSDLFINEDEDEAFTWWADILVSGYENVENPYINGYEQQITVTIKSPWRKVANLVNTGSVEVAKGNKVYNLAYGYRANGYAYGAFSIEVTNFSITPGKVYNLVVPDGTAVIRMFDTDPTTGLARLVVELPLDSAKPSQINSDWSAVDIYGFRKSMSAFVPNDSIDMIRRLTVADEYGNAPRVSYQFFDASGNMLQYQYSYTQTSNFI